VLVPGRSLLATALIAAACAARPVQPAAVAGATLPADPRPAAPGATPLPVAPPAAGATRGRPAAARRPGEIYPTAPGGREWFLPDDADLNDDPVIVPTTPDITLVAGGPHSVYHTEGLAPDGAVRLTVRSPAGARWWRNVEMTGYVRHTATIGSTWPHWSWMARGERHSSVGVTKSRVTGTPPPPGTAVWPWWDALAPDDPVNVAVLGSGYHANVYVEHGTDATVLFEKEITHVRGYCDQREGARPPSLPPARGSWLGIKFVLRNNAAGTAVKMELWLDPSADGSWTKVIETVDQPGAGRDWGARDASLDGATAPPYSYERNQLITWAGPWAIFRADGLAFDFRDLSVREIDPY